MSHPDKVARLLAALPPEIKVEAPGDPLRLRVRTTAEAKALLQRWWPDVVDFEFRHGSMDDVFVSLTTGGAAENEEEE